MSQFDGLLNLKERKQTPEKLKPKQIKKEKPASPPPSKKKFPENSDKTKKLGKSADEDFIQTSIYIKKQTQVSVKTALLSDGEKRDFSDLVEQLLADWIVSRK